MSLGEQKHLNRETTSDLTTSVARSLWELLQKEAHDEGFKED